MLIKRNKQGKPVRVLTGSANFSVRGLYVQSNSIIVIDNSDIAALYAKAFDQTWTDPSKFASSALAGKEHELKSAGLPPGFVSFSPHKSALVSLKRVADEIAKADSSVMYAVMQLSGKGGVMDALRDIVKRKDIFSYGVTQNESGGITVSPTGLPRALRVGFSFLKSKVPAPFSAEYSGGKGQVIHHKFVVVDFNDSDPVVFCGSSNLAEGGEKANGDNLLAIYDRSVASAYAAEAVKLVDHYRFRAMMANAKPGTSQPVLRLKDQSEKWWARAYDPKSMKNTERLLFIR